MKNFLVKTILILFPVLIVLIATELLLKQIPNDYKYKASYLNKNAQNIEIVVLGSSHTFFGVNPVFFEKKSFNMGHVSQSLDYDFLLFDKYKDKFKKLKVVYIPISYFSLWSRLNKGIEKWRCTYYFNSYGITKNIKISDMLFGKGRITSKIRRIVKYMLKGEDDVSCSKLGFGTHNNSQDLKETGKLAAFRHTENIEEAKYICDEHITFLSFMIEWCEKRNIKVVLFTPPAYKTYRENLDKKQFQMMLKTCREIAFKYKNCVYHNFIADSTFSEKDFYDADHLNKKGAEKFTKKLNSCLLKLE